MRHARPPLHVLALLALLATGGCTAATTATPATAPTAARLDDAVARAMVDTISARLTDLEVRRVVLRATLTPANPQLRDADASVAALHAQLRELPGARTAERDVAVRVLAVLDGRQAGLAVERRLLLATYTEQNPYVRRVEDEAREVERRRAELRATLDGRD